MEQTAVALSREKGAHASELEAHAAESARAQVILRIATLTLVFAPAVAVASAAILTLCDEALRWPSIGVFVLSIGGLRIARRFVETRSTRKKM